MAADPDLAHLVPGARAAALLVAWGERRRAAPFLQRLEDRAPDPAGRALAAHLAAALGLPDQAVAVDRVLATVGSEAGVGVDRLDGLTFTHRDWWFNLRASNTEPLLRLNVEAADEPTMVAVRDRVLSMIRNQEAS